MLGRRYYLCGGKYMWCDGYWGYWLVLGVVLCFGWCYFFNWRGGLGGFDYWFVVGVYWKRWGKGVDYGY